METHACNCGLIVVLSRDLDEAGLCVVCGGSGHEVECACLECGVYGEGVDSGVEPGEALAAALAARA